MASGTLSGEDRFIYSIADADGDLSFATVVVQPAGSGGGETGGGGSGGSTPTGGESGGGGAFSVMVLILLSVWRRLLRKMAVRGNTQSGRIWPAWC